MAWRCIGWTYQRKLDREKAEALFEAEMILRSARDGNSH